MSNGWVTAREHEIDADHELEEELLRQQANGTVVEFPILYHYGIGEESNILEEYLLSYYQVYNTIINHGMVYYVPVNYTEAIFTMAILLCSLTVMALIRSYISINMMHQEDILMQKRLDEEQVCGEPWVITAVLLASTHRQAV